jgi:DNA-3-methyladenine glycosylase II
MPEPLNDARLRRAVEQLARRSPELREIRDRHGHPPLWQRPAGFPTLLHIILEQQVSIASARAAFDRLGTLVRPLTPGGFLELDESQLRAIGFSRQKIDYSRGLASAIVERRFSLGRIARLEDDPAREQLIAMRGIGRWSADIYLLMALGRPDIWPQGDLALAQAMRGCWVSNEGLRTTSSSPSARRGNRGAPWPRVCYGITTSARRGRAADDQSCTVAAHLRSSLGSRSSASAWRLRNSRSLAAARS